MTGLFIFCSIIFVHVTQVLCQTATDAKNLHTQLFVTDAYNKKIRPVVDQTAPIAVYINFYLKAINGLDEVNEVLKTTGYLSIDWTDQFLTWDPASYGGVGDAFWPQNDVWKPDVALTNSFKDYKELGVTSLNVYVSNDGTVTWYPFQVFESTCSIDIRFFPFDEQTCSLKFVAWSYTKNEVNMLSGSKGLLLDEYEANSAWDIIDSGWSVKQDAFEAEISFSLTMKRKPLFVLISVILPIILLSVLNIFVFVLPCESGERSGYAVTVFLALAVFLTIVSSTLPANSETIAVFSIFLIIQTVQSTVITLIALMMLRMYSFGEDTPIPPCIATILRTKDSLTCKKDRVNNKIAASCGNGNDCDNDIDIISIRSTKMNDTCKQDNESSEVLQPKYTWKNVINFLDVVCLVFFSSVLVISTVVCFTLSTLSGK